MRPEPIFTPRTMPKNSLRNQLQNQFGAQLGNVLKKNSPKFDQSFLQADSRNPADHARNLKTHQADQGRDLTKTGPSKQTLKNKLIFS